MICAAVSPESQAACVIAGSIAGVAGGIGFVDAGNEPGGVGLVSALGSEAIVACFELLTRSSDASAFLLASSELFSTWAEFPDLGSVDGFVLAALSLTFAGCAEVAVVAVSSDFSPQAKESPKRRMAKISPKNVGFDKILTVTPRY